MKRVFDISIAAFSLVVLSPIWVFIIMVILVIDGKPILFTQTRIGRDHAEFRIFKFRTMRNTTAQASTEFSAGDSSRVTKIGKILRKWKLDELPQLLNVLLGDMSMVGPRPEVKEWIDAYPERWKIVLQIRPGITDPASIMYRNEEELLKDAKSPFSEYRNVILPKKLDAYTEYVGNRSFRGDIKIILKTLAAIIKSN